MIKTYAISLANEHERRTHLLNECSRYGIQVNILDACDMRQATQADIEQLSQKMTHKKPKKQRYLTKGELGCALSHQAVYRQIVAAQDDFALILEDDVQWQDNPCDLLDSGSLKTIAEQYPFDLLLLGYVKTLAHQLPYYHRRIPIKKRVTWKQFTFGTPWEQYACGTVAYIISQQGAQKLLRATTPPHATADDWLHFEEAYDLKILHVRPTLALEDLSALPSTIRIEKDNFLQPKISSIIIRSIKGSLKNFAMNVLNWK